MYNLDGDGEDADHDQGGGIDNIDVTKSLRGGSITTGSGGNRSSSVAKLARSGSGLDD